MQRHIDKSTTPDQVPDAGWVAEPRRFILDPASKWRVRHPGLDLDAMQPGISSRPEQLITTGHIALQSSKPEFIAAEINEVRDREIEAREQV